MYESRPQSWAGEEGVKTPHLTPQDLSQINPYILGSLNCPPPTPTGEWDVDGSWGGGVGGTGSWKFFPANLGELRTGKHFRI